MAPLGFPLWIVVTHFLNLLLMTLMARSGLEILSAFPKLYGTDHCAPGHELIRFSRKVLCADSPRLWSSQEEEESWPPLIALPGRKNLGIGRHWHFLTVQFWVLTGLVYVALLCVSGQWVRLVPTSWTIVPAAFHSLSVYLDGSLPPQQPGLPYNAAQQLAYFAVVFVLAPLQIATGAAMSPAVLARFPWYGRLFGGKQVARLLHFAGLSAFGAFVLVHTAMVVVHGVPEEFAHIVLGSSDPRADHPLALAVGLGGIGVVALINVAATVLSLGHRRRTQRLLGAAAEPMQRLLSRFLVSRQGHGRVKVSPFLRVNGYPPTDPEYQALVQGGFAGYRLQVRGLVETPLTFSLEQLRALEVSEQVTLHSCIQGWTGVAAWTGVPLARVLAACRPLGNARHVVFHAFDDKGVTEPEDGTGHFYESIPIELTDRPRTILALEMNGRPLTIPHGAPVRLRIETQLGYKMVKWVRSIELVADLATVGLGQGGWREDHQYYGRTAGI
jgi:DMSO/TMAO reductase YedYZ molybdopterin-dependent catalytic subunit/thiosulfate reductase cytochrome b subunit